MDVSEWVTTNWEAITAAVIGMVVCTLGGLLAVSADRERPALFVPAYILAVGLFLGGLMLILFSETIVADGMKWLDGNVQ